MDNVQRYVTIRYGEDYILLPVLLEKMDFYVALKKNKKIGRHSGTAAPGHLQIAGRP